MRVTDLSPKQLPVLVIKKKEEKKRTISQAISIYTNDHHHHENMQRQLTSIKPGDASDFHNNRKL